MNLNLNDYPMVELMLTSAALLALVVVLWLVNLILVGRGRGSSIWVNRLMYVAALAALAVQSVRSFIVYEEKTMFAACLVALVCVIISWRRTEHVHRYGPEPDDEDAE